MIRIIALLSLFISTAIALACGGSSTPVANSNAVANGKVNNANMPPGLVSAPAATNTGAPGIPVVIANMQKGATPTPGIPSDEELKKGPKKGTTPTPGIPSPEELKRQMSGGSPNIPPPNASTDTPMMKRNDTPMMKKNTNKAVSKP